MKPRKGSKESASDESLIRLVVGIVEDRIEQGKSEKEIEKILERGNVALDSAAKARKAMFKEKISK